VRQRDLGGLTSLDETTLTRNLRPLIDRGWVAIRPGEDRREKLVHLTDRRGGQAARGTPGVGARPAAPALALAGGNLVKPDGRPPRTDPAGRHGVIFFLV